MTLESIAHHEAGHAVAALELGVPFTAVSIVEDDQTLGRVLARPGWLTGVARVAAHKTTDRRLLIEQRMAVEAVIAVCLAGPAAERRFDPDPPDRDGDFRHAQTFARALGIRRAPTLRAYLARHERHAQLLVERRWSWVEAVAQELISRRVLLRYEVSDVRLSCLCVPETSVTPRAGDF